jgi:hypothetical protein
MREKSRRTDCTYRSPCRSQLLLARSSARWKFGALRRRTSTCLLIYPLLCGLYCGIYDRYIMQPGCAGKGVAVVVVVATVKLRGAGYDAVCRGCEKFGA